MFCELYSTVVQTCEHCTQNRPPLQRSNITGLRAGNVGDLVFVDHDDGATTVVVQLMVQPPERVMPQFSVSQNGWIHAIAHQGS